MNGVEHDTLISIASVLRDRRGRNSSNHSRDPNSELLSLSRSCKVLNDACAHFIFHNYRLVIRSPLTKGKDPFILRYLPQWDHDAVFRRIAHFRSKASFVRELTLVDSCICRDDPPFLPEDILTEILDILVTAERLLFFTLRVVHPDSALYLPTQLWEWLTRKPLKRLRLFGNLCPPDGASEHLSVDALSLSMSKSTIMRFLELARPEHLILKYDPIDQPLPLFDFSGVPDAHVNIVIVLSGNCYFELEMAWYQLRRVLPKYFKEDLDTRYNVCRPIGAAQVMLYRPPLARIDQGWTPEHSAHLVTGEEDPQDF